ncbi:hypothetical protein BgiMline_035401 [Biomphalaria glabrata]|nr:hypothetical protein BgiMline_026263 [Biomphalaria glabrata]
MNSLYFLIALVAILGSAILQESAAADVTTANISTELITSSTVAVNSQSQGNVKDGATSPVTVSGTTGVGGDKTETTTQGAAIIKLSGVLLLTSILCVKIYI